MSLTLVPEAIETYARSHSDEEPALLQELREETRRDAALPQMLSGPLEGSLLRMLVRLVGARRVLEIGTYTGYSALWMADGLPDDGELVTCDVDEKVAAIARRYFERSPHAKKLSLRMGPALETIATLEGPLDLVFLDADKESYGAYFDATLPLVRTGGLIVADNTLWSGRVLAPEGESDRAIAAFNEKVAKDERVERVLLTLRDGVTLARKR